MSKFIIYNKAKINDDDTLVYAAEAVKKYKSKLKAIGDGMYIEYCDYIYGLIKVEIMKKKTCYTIVIY
jgi:hypothetical protein